MRISVRHVHERDRQQLANLIHFETHVHRHLDWRAPLDWIGYSPYMIAERNGAVAATLACPPDPVEVSWIRLFAVSSDWNVDEAWNSLWPACLEMLHRDGISMIGAIPLQNWFQKLIESSRFENTHNIVLLLWQPGYAAPSPTNSDVRIRPMNYDDLPAVHQIDLHAFEPLWRNSIDAIELSFQQSAVATIAENEFGPVGYQISTASPMGGHLARLAVSPDVQGKGVGYCLVHDLLNQFERRGAIRVTVNTQQENTASLALYQRAGFRQTGEKYPVYEYISGQSSVVGRK